MTPPEREKTMTAAPAPLTFWRKAVLAAVLVTAADLLIFDHGPGAGLGVFGLAWTLGLSAIPAVRRDGRSRIALACAALLAAVQFEGVSPLAWLMTCIALMMAALFPHAGRFDDAFRWGLRVVLSGLFGLVRPILDAIRLRAAGASIRRLTAFIPILALPLIGGAVFLALFAIANPVISEVLARVRWPQIDERLIGHVLFCGVVFLAVWSTLRPKFVRALTPLKVRLPETLPGVSVASVTLSLALFNALFALQNGLDIAVLWSGAALPEGMTLADYAHRGAYPLIVTAILAGVFVLVTLAPSSKTAESRPIRWLVVAWIAQNLLLVAFSVERTLDYIDAYSLTGLRIAALVWMGLTAVGLALICWRLVAGRSGAWLINANAAVLALTLAACSAVDFGAVAATWNVRHAREVDGTGAALDLYYLHGLGSSALTALIELEGKPIDPALRAQITSERTQITRQMEERKGDWRAWTWREGRRLKAARTAPSPLTPAVEG